MDTSTFRHSASVLLICMLSMILPNHIEAAEIDVEFEVHPHCLHVGDSDDSDWIFGEIPSPGMIANTRIDDEGVSVCESFIVEDPETLRTTPLAEGDVLDIDIILNNPSRNSIHRVRAWLSYDPNILEGEHIEINDEFSEVTPDEQGFYDEEGYVKIEASASNNGPNSGKVFVARLQFRVKQTHSIGSPITFHDVQPGGHSLVTTLEGGSEQYILGQEPGVLLVSFMQEIEDELVGDEDASSDEDIVGSNTSNADATSSEATNNILKDNGEVCTVDSECSSNYCHNGMCTDSLLRNSNTASDSSLFSTTENPSTDTGNRTAFSLLQIQNLRVTTQGTSLFLSWDALQSSQIKAYNVYYGTTSGRYIQRKTIDKSETSITLRSLPTGVRYFLAVRGLSQENEETAFSKEVSIIVGDPSSSTAPLTLSQGVSGNPLSGQATGNSGAVSVPGETGASSILLVVLLGSACIGTGFALRRQSTVISQ